MLHDGRSVGWPQPGCGILTTSGVATRLLTRVETDRPTVVVITNEDDTNSVRLGPENQITTLVGLLLRPGGAIALDNWHAELFAIAVAGTPKISWLRQEIQR